MLIAISRATLLALAIVSLPQAASAVSCDEDCLLGIAGSYMDSLSANDPAGAPFDAHARTTENGVATPTTEGLWNTAHSWLYRHTFVEPETGEIGAFGSVKETGDVEAMISLRLKVVNRRITESELLVTRKDDFALFQPRFATDASPIYSAFIPPDRRMTRAALEAVPLHYFEAIAAGNPDLVGVHPDANRVENGVQTTNSPMLMSPSTSEGLRRLVYMQTHRNLRVPVVDTARGLVWAVVAIDMPLMTKTLTVRGKPVEINPQRNHLPRTLFLYELFKVEGGRIRAIEAVMRNMPLGADMGWTPAK